LNNKGFTMIEIILVIALIGILASISLPIYRKTMAHHSLHSAARVISTDIRYTQQKSITERDSYRLLFNTTSGTTYQILSTASNSKMKYLPKGTKIIRTNFTDKTLTFYPSGAPSQGGRLVIENNFGDKLYIIVTPATGRVRISDKPPN